MLLFPKNKPKHIEFIEQRKKTDCGVACLAMLVGRLYGEVVALYPKLKRTKGGLYPEDIFEILEDLDYEYYEIKKLPKRGIALVAIEWRNVVSQGHYVVWDSKREQFLDPLHGLINRSDMAQVADIGYIWKIKKIKS